MRALLATHRLFRQANIDALGPLLDDCSRHQLMPGDTLIDAGGRNTRVFLVISGELRVYAGGQGLPPQAVLGPGDCAGEMTLIDGERSAATVLAAAPSELIAIPHERLWEMIDLEPAIARNLLALMAGRVRKSNLILVTTQSRLLEFEEASSVDPLTGLHNRRWMDDVFLRMIRRCRNNHAPVCLVLADIDRLSRINERNGLLTGDTVLKRIARTLAESLRPQDLIGRSGGNEFAILLPQTRGSVALGVAARLCAFIRTAGIVIPPDTEAMTISCGVAQISEQDELDTVFAHAKQALRRAKTAGGGQAASAERAG